MFHHLATPAASQEVSRQGRRTLQMRIAGSRRALLPTTLYALAIWYAAGIIERQLWPQLLLLAVSTYLMIELNNANALLRTYSRMVSCSFLVLTSTAIWLFPSFAGWLTTLCYVAFLTLIFQTYQDNHSTGRTYYAFLCIGLASLLLPQVVFIVPVIWILMASWLMAFSGRMLLASLFGILTPYWFVIPWCVATGRMSWLSNHATAIISVQPLSQWTLPSLPCCATFVLLTIGAITGAIHFLLNSSADKIRTRMLYNIVITLHFLLTAIVALQPHLAELLMGPLLVGAAILTAHFIACTKSKISNFFFLLLLALAIAVTVYNLWTVYLPC